ncbi:MAG: O-antigen ligase family protein [Deltaproteobacteria bacterium]|nr:O-antigen ligase family protein [Kofleriaceae bacterium]
MGLVTLALLFACLAIGGAPRWAACVSAGLGLATAIPFVTSRRTASRVSIFIVPIAAMAALTALQLIPLPMALAEVLVPGKVELVRENARAWGEAEPTWVLASFDPPATLVELAKLAGYLGLAWTCIRLASERQARRWLVTVPAAVAGLVAIATLAHLAVDARKVYGIYQPSTNLLFLGPLVSANHLASLLALAAPLAGSLALQSKGANRAAWFALAALLVGTTFLSGSRGGVLGLVAGGVATGAILFVRHRAGPNDAHPVIPAITVPVALAAAAVMAVLVLLTAGGVSRDLSETSLAELHEPQSKFQVWKRAAQMTADHHWLGVGKGGFEAAFSPYSQSSSVVYSHVENSYLQAVVDWGLPGSALIFFALGLAATAGIRRWRQGVLEAGALGALVALTLHELADFSIELPAVAMTIIASSSLLFPERLAAARRDRDTAVPRRALVLRIAGVAIGLLFVVLAASPLGRNAEEDYARIMKSTDEERLGIARASLERHPASFTIAGRAAEALFAARDARALRLMARSLSMNSNHAGLRHLAARMLLVSNRPEQAAGEFAAAARLSRDVRPIVADVLAAFTNPEDIADALPTERKHAFIIFRALAGKPLAAMAFAKRVGDLHPHDPEVQALVAEAALAAREGTTALTAASRAWELSPIALHAVLLGRAHAMLGAKDTAASFLANALDSTVNEAPVERVRLIIELAEARVALGDLARAKTVLEMGRDLAAAEQGWLILVHTKLAEVEDRLGNRNQAAWERQRVRELQGRSARN